MSTEMDELLESIDLGERGLAWVRAALSGGGALSRAAAEGLPLAHGGVRTLLPRRAFEEAFDFEDGIQLSPVKSWQVGSTRIEEARGETWERASEALIDEARASYGDVLVVEDLRGRPIDNAGTVPPDAFVVSGDCYYRVDLRDRSAAEIDRFVSMHGLHHSTVAYVLALRGFPGLRLEGRDADATRILGATEHLLVGAYDASGYVLWTRSR